MIKHYCDRCGKEIKGVVRSTTDGEIYKVKMSLPGYNFSDMEAEYCYGCLKVVVGENLVRTMDERRAEAKKRQEERKAERKDKPKAEPRKKEVEDIDNLLYEYIE